MIPYYLDMLVFLSCSYQSEAAINALNAQLKMTRTQMFDQALSVIFAFISSDQLNRQGNVKLRIGLWFNVRQNLWYCPFGIFDQIKFCCKGNHLVCLFSFVSSYIQTHFLCNLTEATAVLWKKVFTFLEYFLYVLCNATLILSVFHWDLFVTVKNKVMHNCKEERKAWIILKGFHLNAIRNQERKFEFSTLKLRL